MIRKAQITFLVLSLLPLALFCQESAGKKTLIRYATAHVGNGERIDNALLAIQGNEITLLADGNKTRINVLDYDSIIDAEGKHIYPGFIVMDSRLGLVEIGAVRATHDYDETGDLTPHVRTLPAFNTESKVTATVRTNGVLMGQIAPLGGVLSGTSSCMHFNGNNWQDAKVRADEGLFLNWPNSYRYSGWWAEPGSAKSNSKYKDKKEEIVHFFQEARAYAADSNQKEKNLKFESMRGLFNGTKRLYIRANWARDIVDATLFYRSSGAENMTILGGAEAHLVTTELKENNIAVVIDRVHKLPSHLDDPVSQPYTLASELTEAGIDIAFATSGDMEAMISRNLPFQVGTAVFHGLEYEKAIQAITLQPAILMGIDHKYGTIESGKRATFFMSEGDALDIGTNNITSIFIEGESVDLSNHQSDLHEKFKP
jgi:hypothetical protein